MPNGMPKANIMDAILFIRFFLTLNTGTWFDKTVAAVSLFDYYCFRFINSGLRL